MSALPTAWVEVNTDAIRNNYREIKRFVGPEVAVMAVIKTNGYGHGLELVAETLKNEADWFGVSTIEEAVRLRSAAPSTPTLVFQPLRADTVVSLVELNLTGTIDGQDGADALGMAARAGRPIPEAHLKVDSGMSRYGIPWWDALAFYRSIVGNLGIRITGVYTHLATAPDPNTTAAKEQLRRFADLTRDFGPDGTRLEVLHALNSAGILRFPNHRYSMVRVGTLLYGQYPANVPHSLELLPTWALKSRIFSIRQVLPGTSVGYGAEWTAKRRSRIATLPIGYADGPTLLPRSVRERESGIRNWLKGLLGRSQLVVQTPHGTAPVVGRVASQSMMLDITDLPDVQLGDIVQVPSRRLLVGEHIPRVALGPQPPAPNP